MINRTYIWTLIALFLSAGIALGGYDLSGSEKAEKLSISSSALQGLEVDAETLAAAQVPQMIATEAGTEQAFYTTQTPTKNELKTLLPFDIDVSPVTHVFFKGSYLGWNGFAAQYPGAFPGLWIERSVSWSWYATMPLGSWARELLYVPTTSPIYMFEVYPGGYVMKYNLGSVQPGYYYIWYYADAPGRHLSVFGSNSGYSNTVTIDVYAIHQFRPKPLDPRKECEKNSLCVWENGKCNCFKPSPNPVAECEKNPNCDWVNGQCLCRGLEPLPGPLPSPDPEPVPQPAPNPFPEPTPGPNKAAICQQNPGCHWANGQCLCMGLEGYSSDQPSYVFEVS